jgi:flagellar protein FlaG
MEVFLMALEVLSGAVYHDSQKPVPKQNTNAAAQDMSAANINITEVPATVKTSGGNQTGQENGQNKGASANQIKQAIRDANNKMKTHRTRCEFSYHEETKRVSIKVLDEETKEVIREIPPEETLEMIQKMWELAGILVDEKR